MLRVIAELHRILVVFERRNSVKRLYEKKIIIGHEKNKIP